MLNNATCFKKIFIVTGYTDLRSGIDCLADTIRSYLGEEKEGLTIAGCWAHARRRYDEAVKALPSKSRKSSIAWQALEQIEMIYHVDNTLKELKPEERKNADRVV